MLYSGSSSVERDVWTPIGCSLRQKSVHQRAAGMNAGEVMLAKRLMTMAALNVMNGGEEEATFVALMA